MDDRRRDLSPRQYRDSRDSRDGRDGRDYRERDHRQAEEPDYLMDLKEYKDKRGSRNSEDVEKKYEIYRQEYIKNVTEKFFNANCTQEWFLEKYHPTESVEFKSQILRRKYECLDIFESDLSQGKYDQLDLDEKEDEEGFGFDIQANPTTAEATLFITGVGCEVKRAELVQLFATIPGFRYLELTEPRIEKRNSRLGWIILELGSDVEGALIITNEKQIGEHQISVLSPKGIATSLRSVIGACSKPSRLELDFKNAVALTEYLDKEAGFDSERGCAKILQKVGPMPVIEATQDMDMDIPEPERGFHRLILDIDVAGIKLRFDLYLLYLHKVHFYDYYTGLESSSPEDHTRRGGIPTRKQYIAEKDDLVPFWMTKLDSIPRIHTVKARQLEVEIDKRISFSVRKEGDSKFRCTECQKLFRGDDFARKHIQTKHPHLIQDVPDAVEFYNNFSSRGRVDIKSYAKETRGRERKDYRDDRRSQGRYHDLDAVAEKKVVLNYD